MDRITTARGLLIRLQNVNAMIASARTRMMEASRGSTVSAALAWKDKINSLEKEKVWVQQRYNTALHRDRIRMAQAEVKDILSPKDVIDASYAVRNDLAVEEAVQTRSMGQASRAIMQNIRVSTRRVPPRVSAWEKAEAKTMPRWRSLRCNTNTALKKSNKRKYWEVDENVPRLDRAYEAISVRGHEGLVVRIGVKMMYRIIAQRPSTEMTNGGRCWAVNDATLAIDNQLHQMGLRQIGSMKEPKVYPVPLDYQISRPMLMACPFIGVPLMVIPQYDLDGIRVCRVFGMAWVLNWATDKARISETEAGPPKDASLCYCEWWAATSVHLENIIITGAVMQKDAIQKTEELIVKAVSEAL